MRVKLGKKKVDLGTRLEKKDVHNLLNSLLVWLGVCSRVKLSRRTYSTSFGAITSGILPL